MGSLQETVSAERVNIGFFGMVNAGKSSVVNAVTGQEAALVSEIEGTTTDPVKKSMELLPIGPVLIIDTPGIDDATALGRLRINKALQVLGYTDIAVLVVDTAKGIRPGDKDLIAAFKEKNIPYVVALNKCDRVCSQALVGNLTQGEGVAVADIISVSAKTKENIHELKELLARKWGGGKAAKPLLSDIVGERDIVVLVTPVDSAAPKGRLILPQQQTVRDLLDSRAITIAVQPGELAAVLSSLQRPPKLVVTDSKVFDQVNKTVPPHILLTSFSIVFARYKGDLQALAQGAYRLDTLPEGASVLIAEGCTHHTQCEDIGTVKLPAWIRQYTRKNIHFDFVHGKDFAGNVSGYDLIIHCGACMLHEKEMENRALQAKANKVPMTNYGLAIAQMHGILKRAMEPFV